MNSSSADVAVANLVTEKSLAGKLQEMSVPDSVSAVGSYAASGNHDTKFSLHAKTSQTSHKEDGQIRNPKASAPGGVKAGDWLPNKNLGEVTKFVHAGENPEPTTGAIISPIFQSTTFVQESVEMYQSKGYSYSRTKNPSVTTLEEKLAEVEGGKAACCFSSGMAATSAVFGTFLRPGDHCILPTCSYGGTNRCARLHFAKYGISFDFVDFRDVKAIERSLRPGTTKLVFSETPSNPTLFLADVEAISKLCKRVNILHVCDSTFATPCIMRPLLLGADMTLVSTTKFYDGHNLTVGGAVICSDMQHYEQLVFHRNVVGSIMSPQVAFYTLITVKTLPLRMQKQSSNAMEIAQYLERHEKVERVLYPGLPSFPQRQLAMKQHAPDIHGSMIGFEVVGGTEAGIRLMDNVPRPWSLCENLGAVQSIITCPAVFTHAAMTREDRLKVGITDGFIRLSVGIEDVEDLIRSLEYALSCV